MLKVDRHKFIQEQLQEKGSIMVSALSFELNVTEETIRRDLEELEQQEKLKRVRGGAYLPQEFDKEVPIQIRENIYTTEKELIAKKAMEFISPNDTIMLDSSTTAYHIALKIKEARIKVTIITNSLKISQLAETATGIKLVCTGGVLRQSSNSFVGYSATDSLSQYFADKAFVSCSTLCLKQGMTDNSSREGALRKIMLENAQENYLIVDYTKFDAPSLYKIADLAEVETIITDKPLNKLTTTTLSNQNIKVVIATE
ncbi:DeoR/GlpR family transcriptional regulator of sugar metabolism [Enterococcus sp. PF1-24]|uniref:DeoR/GlpR family DNA-binding transcription regulator n=1 Tax=unclassified Enterococcus TaxID=2608891 RepID=UPI0024764BCF|nr:MULTISPECIES: DeoR/GlpR family DNA-binding transcription regulator [unclassified Enterococcus]MDH6363956.1 DeoR/GlpR family transcriptional regulator of sugar metabolism [Enterococcus sp. PFB1-1]MDH6401057.1 DeoR/GlpR family transcriptional regulator of sugar metabolism [Enterococcus sp. PF1-24]